MPFKYKIRPAKQPGLPPGTVVHVGEQKAEEVKITIIDFDENTFAEKTAVQAEDCFPYRDTPTRSWINIDGVHETNVIQKIGKHFNIHPLTQEDIAHVGQRPKVEEYTNYIFIELNVLLFNKENELTADQISFVLGKNYLLTFQEKETDIFQSLRERLHSGNVKIRKRNLDYLAYSLIDTIIDHYFVVLEKIGEKIEALEEKAMKDHSLRTLHQINHLKREIIFLRKSVWPAREVINNLSRTESPLVSKDIDIYLRDVYDHTIQVIDTIENYRDIIASIQEIYLSGISIKTNEVMKVLTVISTIFIPLTFIVGIYGMNFEFMPELKWKGGYFLVWGVMFLVAGGMLVYFKRRKWF